MSAQPAPVHNLTATLARECALGLPSEGTLAALAGHAGFLVLATAGAPVPGPDDVPEPVGTVDADGRHLVYVFTDVRRVRGVATRLATEHGQRDIMSATLPWHGGIRYLLHTPCAGVVVDEGSEDRIVLDRSALAHLLAGLALEPLIRRDTLHVVVENGLLHVECPTGQDAHAFLYDSETAAAAARQMIEGRGLPLAVEPRPTATLLRTLHEANIAFLNVNRGLPDAHAYDMASVGRMERHLPLSGAVPFAPPAGSGRPQTSALHVRPTAPRGRPLQPPLPRTDADARALFLEWRQVAVAQTLPIWQFLEALASQGAFYVARGQAPVDGLSWPWQLSVRKQPENAEATLVQVFTTETAARAAIAAWPRARQRLLRLSGLEAFRWIWASPGAISDVAIDYPADDGWMVVPIRWLRHALFPLGHEIGDMDTVPHLPVSALAGLPGSRGLRPEVLRGLLDGWRDILDLAPGGDGSLVALDLDGLRLLPVFSGREAFDAFTHTFRSPSATSRPAGTRPPFDAWLTAARDLDGVVLDPAAPTPLVLDHGTMTLLDLWAGRRTPPEPADLVREARCRLHDGTLAPRVLPRLVAEVPEYWLAMLAPSDDDITVLHMPDDAETGVLFTNQEAAREFFERNPPPRTGDAGPGTRGMPITLLARPHQWSTSAFLVVAEEFDRVVIDPNPDGSGGLALDREAIEGVLDALDERLRPRIPGFVWED